MKSRDRFEVGMLLITCAMQLFFLIKFLVETGGTVAYAKWKEVDSKLFYTTETYQAGKLFVTAVLVVLLFEVTVTLWGIYSRTYLGALAASAGMLLYFGMFIQVFYNGGQNLHKHVLFSLAGMAAMWIYYFLIRVKLNEQQGKYIMIGISVLVVLNVMAIAIGAARNGSYAWFSIGGISIQPGEFLKVLIILLSAWIYRYRLDKKMTRLYLLFCGISVAVLVASRDLGNAVVLLAICLVSSWFIFDKWYYTALAMLAGILGLAFAAKYVEYVRLRFEACFHALESGEGQQYQSLMSILKHGIHGCGPAGDTVSATYITSSATDLTFNAIVSIFGIIWAAAIIIFVVVLFVQLLITPVVSPFHYLLGVLGVTTYFTQYIFHVGGNLNVIPLTGICMSFISTGGSNMFSSFLIFSGILSCMSPGFAPIEIRALVKENKDDYKYSRKKNRNNWFNDFINTCHGFDRVYFDFKKSRRRYRKSKL